MNTYALGLNIFGKSGRKYSITLLLEAESKESAEAIARQQLKEDGFESVKLDYCDWAD